MKKTQWIRTTIISVGLGAMVAAMTFGAPGSPTKGKYYFKKTCKPCHAKASENGELTPLTHTQAQWKAYFKAGKHAKGKEQLTKYLDATKLNDVEAFLVDHASDSPQPETCGG
jgi:cytochrome c553